MTKTLTVKEARFIPQYLLDGNGTRAAVAAGYSERTAARIASTLLAKPHIRAALDKALKAQERRTLVKADRVLLDINDIANAAWAAGEFGAAIRGKELLGKHYKLFTDQLEVKDVTPRADRLAAARARRAANDAAPSGADGGRGECVSV